MGQFIELNSQLTMASRTGSTHLQEQQSEFLNRVLRLVVKAAFTETSRDAPVLRWRSPNHLKEVLQLSLSETGCTHDELLEHLENVIKFSAKTGHPHFINQLFSGLDTYGLAGQLITDALNPSVYTYEVAPVFTLMETEVLNTMCQLIGFEQGEGIFCPGGSFANGFALNLARYKFNPELKRNGLCSTSRLILFASVDAHYSVHKMAAFLGLGEDAVVLIPTDAAGKMDPVDMQQNIELARRQGSQPFLIFATAGTTVLGAIDPLEELATIAEANKLWLHIDAAWAGGLLFSQKHRHLLKGIHRADSVTWNPHKLLAVPQQCSALLVRHSNLLLDCHNRNADYLFQKDKFYDTRFDVGDKYLQCGRRADVLKFWLMWKAKGSDGFAKHVDHLMDVSQHLVQEIQRRRQFVLVAEPQFINVCFWYVPQHIAEKESHPDYFHMLHKVAPVLKEAMLRRGSMMINYQPLRHWPNFFRFVAQNPDITMSDADFFLNEIERLGKHLHSSVAP